MISFDEIPAWLRWVQWLCFLRYGWVAQMVNTFGGDDAEVFGDPGGEGQTVLEFYDIDGANLSGNVLALAAWATAFAIGAGLALTYVRHQSR